MAYDFVQQRDAGTKARVNDRQVIKTIEDQHKYDMPDQRRLYVAADVVNTPVPVKSSGLNKLAMALAEVKPHIMDYLADKESTKNAQLYEQGKMDAMSGKDPASIEDEWQKKGYDYLKSTNDWTAWNEQVTNEYTNGFDKDNGDVNQFLSDKWNTIDWENKSQDYKDRFTKLASKTFDTTRADHSKYMVDKQEAELDATISQTFYDDIKESINTNGNLSIYDIDARVKDLADTFKGRGLSQLNLLAYSAVDRIANDIINDPNSTLQDKSKAMRLYDVFKENYPNGTPGLYATKHRATIDRDMAQATSAYNSAVLKQDQQTEKALKELGKTADRHVETELLRIMTTTEGQARATEIKTLTDFVISKVGEGVPFSDSVLNTLRSVSVKDANAADTKEQAKNYGEMRANLEQYSKKQIHAAFNRDELSLTGFNSLMSAKDSAENKAEGGKNYTKLKTYKDFKSDIKVMMGYNPFNYDKDSEEKSARINQMINGANDEIENMVEAGKSPREAVDIAVEATKKRMREMGWVSKTFDKQERDFNKDKRDSNPWAYYSTGNGTAQDLLADKDKFKPDDYAKLQQIWLKRRPAPVAPAHNGKQHK
jgi:hypothetical protein